jgi:pyridoxal biosynthesis lyase PdxS
VERTVGSPLGRLVAFWSVLGDWLEAREFIGCPFLNTLVEIRDADTPPRRAIESYVQEVEEFFVRTAAAAGVPVPAAAGRQLRYNAMGLFMGVRLERSRRPLETARATTLALLATWLDTTIEDLERQVAAEGC